MRVIRRRRVTNRSVASREHVTQEVSQLFNFVVLEIVIVPEGAILGRFGDPLDAGVRDQVEILRGGMNDCRVHASASRDVEILVFGVSFVAGKETGVVPFLDDQERYVGFVSVSLDSFASSADCCHFLVHDLEKIWVK